MRKWNGRQTSDSEIKVHSRHSFPYGESDIGGAYMCCHIPLTHQLLQYRWHPMLAIQHGHTALLHTIPCCTCMTNAAWVAPLIHPRKVQYSTNCIHFSWRSQFSHLVSWHTPPHTSMNAHRAVNSAHGRFGAY